MALTPPNKNWNKVPIGKDEKLWALLIVIMISMMGFMTVGFLFFGHQNPPEEYHRYAVDDIYPTFLAGNDNSGAAVVDLQHDVKDTSGNQVQGLSLLTGGDIYLIAHQWEWLVPVTGSFGIHAMQFKAGETYRLHIASTDVLHGFQVIGGNFIIALQIVPGYDYVLDFIPNNTGLFRIICNEFCGAGSLESGHQAMTGFLEIV